MSRTGLAAAVLVIAACSGSGGGGSGGASASATPLIATVDEQGTFNTPCGYSHSLPDDPIVHAGMAGMSHRHDFFGATTTEASSDAASLLAGGTNCRSVADHTGYWAPALLAAGVPVQPTEMLAYYRVPIGADATKVEAPPNGLEMIAGDFTSEAPQDPEVVSWQCGFTPEISAVPMHCPPGMDLRLQLHFDPCWNGEDLGSEDHRSHLAPLGDDGSCPESHPVLIPELTVEVRYPTGAVEGDLTLASGPLTGGHGDALVAWDEDHIADEVETCLRENLNCNVVSETSRLGFDQLDG